MPTTNELVAQAATKLEQDIAAAEAAERQAQDALGRASANVKALETALERARAEEGQAAGQLADRVAAANALRDRREQVKAHAETLQSVLDQLKALAGVP